LLFCDLVGSTEIAARLDPEDWREILAEYHRVAAHSIGGSSYACRPGRTIQQRARNHERGSLR